MIAISAIGCNYDLTALRALLVVLLALGRVRMGSGLAFCPHEARGKS
jgi:hypothetical protein